VTAVGMAVAAETEIEIVAAQDIETPIEGDPTVEIESTTVDESQIVVDNRGTPDRGRSRSRSRSRDRIDYEARDRAQMHQRCATALDRCPRHPSSLLATAQPPECADPSCSTTARCAHCSTSSQVQSPRIRASSMAGPHARGRVVTWLVEK
jgi:hypothetical protein